MSVVIRETNIVIGYCGFYLQKIELGYRLHSDTWNQGLATEAAHAIKEYGFETLGYVRLISTINAENAFSIRVAETCDIRFEKE